jgi:hypothetical protein
MLAGRQFLERFVCCLEIPTLAQFRSLLFSLEISFEPALALHLILLASGMMLTHLLLYQALYTIRASTILMSPDYQSYAPKENDRFEKMDIPSATPQRDSDADVYQRSSGNPSADSDR